MTDATTRTAWAFQFNTGLLQKATRAIPPDRWSQTPGDHSNSMLWVAGHLVWGRGQILQLLGQQRPEPWLTLFARGTTPDAAQQYPQPEEILRAWTDASKQLESALAAASDEALARPAPDGLPTSDGHLSGALQFLTIHEGYHLGQLGYLRKWLGFSPTLG
ncbi:MAG: DinB family protein [Terriglobales bacterium]